MLGLLLGYVTIGSMVLTLYCAHIVVLATGLLGDQPYAQYLVLLAGMIAFAVVWKRRFARGPLEELIARISLSAQKASHLGRSRAADQQL